MEFPSPPGAPLTFAPAVANPLERPVIGVAMHYSAGHIVPPHQHPRGHLIYADRGLLRVEADTGQWLVPPTAAVWLRPGVRHRLVVPVDLQAHGIYLRKDMCMGLPETDRVMPVSGLLKELILSLTALGRQAPVSRRADLLGQLLVEELRAPPSLPFHLPWPAETEIREVCQTLVRNPSHPATADDWASILAVSSKTFHRRFLKNTGLPFGKWRQHLRLMTSFTLLMQGMPITQVALNSGYDSHSAYATAFRKQFGQSPSEFAGSVEKSSRLTK
ncbi:helix-turn-helix domain-containing protein [Pseudomonas sp. MYb185]|uniref:AraC family transcriptional regulator n=1 Tax=Pseudomonas sp. MYb185 TaxID=1848729 RepID=UPI000CFD7AA7|nr:helix-turn-helix transcriptional regulator [Pseudomonas sp. MYb185]PRB74798.1 AraC family transcriptional regulator [Pseudomonas sp. MYb185]